MSWENIHVDDFGWVGKLTIVQDSVAQNISSYSTRQFLFQKPDASILTRTAIFDSDGTNGVLKYVTLDGDIDTAGTWSVQARVAKAGVELTSALLVFQVEARADE